MRSGRRRADERGQISVMVVGFLLMLGLMTVVVVDASSAFLQHQRLDGVADGAALAATQALREEQVYAEGIDDRVDLDPAAVREVVRRYVEASGERGVTVSVDVDDDVVTVHLRRRAALPLTPPGWDGTAPLQSDATARLAVGD